MRLIDADALIKAIADFPYGYRGMIKNVIAEQPTVEPERKKGKWIPHPNKEFREWDVCTACGTGCKRREYGKNPNGTEYVTQYNYPFCPNCGADMREPTK